MPRASRVSNPASAAAAKNGKGASNPTVVFGILGVVLGGGVVWSFLSGEFLGFRASKSLSRCNAIGWSRNTCSCPGIGFRCAPYLILLVSYTFLGSIRIFDGALDRILMLLGSADKSTSRNSGGGLCKRAQLFILEIVVIAILATSVSRSIWWVLWHM
jgi:hypothetical protein